MGSGLEKDVEFWAFSPLMVDRFFMLIYHILLVKGRLATLGGDG